ncbi:MAG: GTPase HflX [Pseudomonadota bacterium]
MLFERPAAGRKAVLLHVSFGQETAAAARERLQELAELATSAAMAVVEQVTARRRDPHPRWFVGSGKLEELKLLLSQVAADVLVVNHELSPGQQRNIEETLGIGVLSRTELILNIFADRARTHEGQLQVELAQCKHAKTRLVRGWTHLDRQKGGVGMRGAGEKQIELDQRMLDARIKSVQQKLARVRARRAQGRRRRRREEVPTVALVGYTNAGKSTLFNALTSGEVMAEDRLFATLDPTLRRLALPGLGDVVLADTVGFIRDLPHDLVEAFKATLEEVAGADLLLHVIDGADPLAAERVEDVRQVLAELDAHELPCLLVLNKSDLPGANLPLELAAATDDGVRVSALTGAGLTSLKRRIAMLLGPVEPLTIRLGPEHGRTLAWLYEIGAVVSQSGHADGGWEICARLDDAALGRLRKAGGVVLQGLEGVHRISCEQ